jgi:photosystem II stability/assembly factor-like uncharacterized protein
MKKLQLFFSLIALCLALASLAQAVPTRLSADAGEVRDIRFASGSGATAVLYAATQGGGVFKSSNAGQTWAPTGLNTGYAWKIAVSTLSTSRVYAATDAGVFRSVDAGATWAQVTFDPARAVAIDPGSVTNDTVLAGVSGLGILRSTDSGTTWARQSTGLDSANVTQLAFQSSGVAYAVLDCNSEDLVPPQVAGGWGGVFKTTTTGSGNATVTWVNFNAGGGAPSLPTKCVKALAANATTVYAGTYDPVGASGQVYRSTGAGWIAPTPLSDPTKGDLFGVESLAIDRVVATTVHAGARAIGVWSSSVAGTWVQKVDPTPVGPAPCPCDPDMWTRINAIESVPGLANTVLAAAKGIGIMRSTNYNLAPANQIAWNVAPGITADRVRGLANHANAAPNTFWMALENGGVMKSTDAGVSWAEFDVGFDFGAPLGTGDPYLLSAQAIAADPSNASVVLVGTRGGGLLAYNGSTGWTTAGVPAVTQVGGVDFKPQSLVIPSSNQVYYALFDAPGGGKAGGLLVSATGPAGLAQTPYPDIVTNCGTPVGATSSARKVVQAASFVAFLLRYDGLPYRSTNNFASNTAGCVVAPSTGYERLAFTDIAQQPNNTAIVVGSTSKGIFRSTDSGNTWARLAVTGLNSQVLSSLAYIGTGYLFGVDRSGGFYCSADNGDNWQNASLGGLPPVSFRELKVLKGAIHIITDGGGVYNGFAGTCP